MTYHSDVSRLPFSGTKMLCGEIPRRLTRCSVYTLIDRPERDPFEASSSEYVNHVSSSVLWLRPEIRTSHRQRSMSFLREQVAGGVGEHLYAEQ